MVRPGGLNKELYKTESTEDPLTYIYASTVVRLGGLNKQLYKRHNIENPPTYIHASTVCKPGDHGLVSPPKQI